MERLWFIANLAEVLDDRPDFSLVRMHCPPGDQPPVHVHAEEDEGFYVLSGSVTVWAGAAEPVVLDAGDYALAPRGVPHTYRAGDNGAVMLVSSAPGTFVPFLREAGQVAPRPELPVLDGPPDAERLATIAAAHGITLLGPPGMLPLDLATATS
jgi:quercetin dioxygenase-like cupin family protein